MKRSPFHRKPAQPRPKRAISSASPAQRAKTRHETCVACGAFGVDPAHVIDRSLGGCDDPDCVVPLCRLCHHLYDTGRLDLLPMLEPGHRVELAHAIRHVGLLRALARVTNCRWRPAERTA